ncbi:DUF397 domain-containing protein [Pseudonocardia spinosispora]|uniref:DUF397 domain-containing protein n=1 Tax=Pseudonocardia spinosispora TaxID=103441 RepID=UPI0004141F68|nr:DUF397 domain-containing protein [Pseudonocardia spinosispora]
MDLELISPWRVSSYSGNDGNCVEVAASTAGVLVRDTKDRQGGMLGFGQKEWKAFLAGVNVSNTDVN